VPDQENLKRLRQAARRLQRHRRKRARRLLDDYRAYFKELEPFQSPNNTRN